MTKRFETQIWMNFFQFCFNFAFNFNLRRYSEVGPQEQRGLFHSSGVRVAHRVEGRGWPLVRLPAQPEH
jgi:hypothetical protein